MAQTQILLASIPYEWNDLEAASDQLAQGKRTQAGKILAGMYPLASKTRMVSSMIEVRAMQAIAAQTPNDALRFLREALTLAQPEKFIRTFL